MVSSSKILTVSYGTFSCTAEGFEDPLAAMKETTHFFRSVVSEDRFFGAEPPQFDPEIAGELMREHLAKRQMTDGQVNLGLPQAAAVSTGAIGAALAAGASSAAPSQDDLPEGTEAAGDSALPDDDTIEATAYDPTPENAPELDADVLPPQASEALTAFSDPEEHQNEPAETAAPVSDVVLAADAAPADEAPALPVEPAASVAAKLDRIRAVVAQDTFEDQDENLTDDVIVPSPEDAPAETVDPSVEFEDEDAALDDNLFADTIASLMAENEPNGETIEAEAVEPAAEKVAEPETLFDVEDDVLMEEERNEIDKVLDAAFDDDNTDFDLSAALDQVDASQPSEEPTPAASSEPDVAPEPDVEAPRPAPIRARVVKVKRAAFEKVVSEGQLEEIEDEDDVQSEPVSSAPVQIPEPAKSSSLSDAEEDELARELAAIKAEVYEAPSASTTPQPAPMVTAAPGVEFDTDEEDDFDIDPSVLEGARKAVKLASPARAMLTENRVEDNDTSRILDQTNSELDEPEGSRRRSAIAHLRAAVAATKADRLLGRNQAEEDQAEPYREDLANVVRPRRPQPNGPRTERPNAEASRPAPLQLVAEQRIAQDTPPSEPTPVRPRRVARAATASSRQVTPLREDPVSEGEFAEYAESVGAKSLPQLLEAAAAYMSYVEGRDQFSRPQLMTTVRQAEETESSREDRLRSFGQLLRDGKIEKTSGGRFTSSETNSFKPAQAAG